MNIDGGEDSFTWENVERLGRGSRWPFRRYQAKLVLHVGSGSSLPPTDMPFTKHFMGVNMGYTCRAWTWAGLQRKMRKSEREAGL